jgi:hypothetical protein
MERVGASLCKCHRARSAALVEQAPVGVPFRQKQSAPLHQNITDLGDDFMGMLEALLDLLQQFRRFPTTARLLPHL